MIIGILDKTSLLTKYFRQNLPADYDPTLQLVIGSVPDALSGLSLDLLAVAPDFNLCRWEKASAPTCRLLLLPGSAAPLARELNPASAVSYGASPRDTLTISSLESDQVAVAIQRDLITVQNRTVEQQELILPVRGPIQPLYFLACTGLLLLLGIAPETLHIFPFTEIHKQNS